MQPAIRQLEARDREAVVALSLRAWEPVFVSLEGVLGSSGVYPLLVPDWRKSQREAVEAACGEADTSVWVADTGPAVAGFVALRLDHEQSVGEIHMIAVDPSHQRRGIGAALTAFALDRLRDGGMALAMVETGGDEGHAPARRAYERAGFAELPVMRYFRTL